MRRLTATCTALGQLCADSSLLQLLQLIAHILPSFPVRCLIMAFCRLTLGLGLGPGFGLGLGLGYSFW